MRIVFFGSSNYCLPVLESLFTNFKLSAIVTKKNQLVEKYALLHNVNVFTPIDTIELLGLTSQIRRIKPDLAVVADYGLIIPKEIFTIPRHQTLNIHFSKLPKLRGPSPVQYTILLGEKSAWISVILIDEGIDTGDVIWQSADYPINQLSNYQMNSEDLYKKLFKIIAAELPDIINKYVNGELKPQKQDHSQATYTKHFTRNDGFIPFQTLAAALNWKSRMLPAVEIKKWPLVNKIPQLLITNYQLSVTIERACRALSPWPGVWTYVRIAKRSQDTSDADKATTSVNSRWRNQDKKRLKILKVHLEPKQSNPLIPLNSGGRHTDVEWKLVIDQVQLEGKKPVSWKQFQEGYPCFRFENILQKSLGLKLFNPRG